jgi:PAS domain S-box-containing protein
MSSDGETAGLDLGPEFFRETVRQIGTGVAAYDATGTIRFANDFYAGMLGTEPSELVGRHIADTNPDFDRDRFEDYWASFEDGKTRRVDTRHRRLDDGTVFSVKVSTTRTTIDGATYHVGTIEDITERKEYEQRLKAQRDNLETLNRMVRHDIRNVLQLVSAHAELLEEHVDEEGREHLGKVRESAANAVELTKSARELADVMLQADIENQQTALVPALERAVEDVRTAHPAAVVGIDSVPRTDVVGNEMLDSVFRNLLQNAVQHNEKDLPEVTVSGTVRDGAVEVRVADNGPGVPDSRTEEIFGKGERGFESGGTGIGLYLVRSLVERYGGEVWVEDNDPEGAVFVVRLPVAETEPGQ